MNTEYGDYIRLPSDTKMNTVIEFLEASRDEAMEFIAGHGGFGKVESVTLLFKRQNGSVTVGWKVEVKGGTGE